jgi:redox-sensitive bicupin YhaK (pirin superfamily)
VYMNSNSTVYYGSLKKDKELDFQTFDIRKTFIYLTEGELFVNGVQTFKHDQARIDKTDLVTLNAAQDSRFILIDVPAVEANY